MGELHSDLICELPIFRIWEETGTSLNEIRYEWTYDDVMKANAILDRKACISIAQESYMAQKAEKDQ